MDDKKITLVASLISLAAIAIVVAAFFWDASSSMKHGQATPGSTAADQREGTAEKAPGKESTSAVIIDAEHTQAQPEAMPEKEPARAAIISLPDPDDAVPDKSTERFGSDDDEEDTDDGIVIETEPDDE